MKKSEKLTVRMDVAQLEDIPNIGVSIASNLRQIGIAKPHDLHGRDPYELYDLLNRVTGARHDPCVLDTFIAAVRYMDGGPKTPWWKFTNERKATLAERELKSIKSSH
ncbi:MAG: helix-hairpin-helix domain-containing protein [Pirellulaceae bacterium]